jgi:hypothetical protein
MHIFDVIFDFFINRILLFDWLLLITGKNFELLYKFYNSWIILL